MLAELKNAKEIAIDLEHHDVHSYHGLVSLMQISTRDKDWVVDTLQPWREELQQLNEVFADPTILKVLHGSRMDIIWLQRDLGLYVVGMFDTYHAAVALGYPKRSLKFLLEKFVNFTADKKYQMADWRLRPLTEEMFNYACADTHYLLYIYDHLRNELLENSEPGNSLVDYVLEQSKIEALQRYERPVYDTVHGQGAGGWYDVLTRNSTVLSKEQFAVFKAVHQWRDEVARAEDEGVQCVFPKHVLFKVAMTMPLDKYTLFKTISPVTLIVKERVSELIDVIKNAKLAGATGPELRDIVIPRKFTAGAPEATTISQPEHMLAVGKDVVSSSAVRAEFSQFWGSALQTNETAVVPAAVKVAASLEALRLSLPIPPMPMTVSEAREKLTAAPSMASPQPIPPVPTPAETKTGDIFTIKEIASRRKRKISKESEVSSASSEEGSDEDTSEADSLEEEQPAKKPRQVDTKKSSGRAQESTPFDYSTAPSVLHAKQDPATRAGPASDKHKKPFNPYAKSLNTTTGMRKSNKDTTGKAFTFRR
jgi:exosome complex exonuclease RRP6